MSFPPEKPFLREALLGRGRAVPIFGITQILGWGSTYYTPALVAPILAAEFGWSLAFAFSGVTIGLIVAGLCSPLATQLVNRFGGHVAIAAGALIAAIGLVTLTFISTRIAFVGVWIWLGFGMSLILSDPSYVALTQIFRGRARRPMVILTMLSGLAGTISWPTTYLLMQTYGWRSAYLFYAALFVLVAAPLLVFALPRPEPAPSPSAETSAAPAPEYLPPHGTTLWLQFVGFSTYAFTIAAMLAHFIPMTGRSGIDTGTAVAIAMLIGPMQLASRLFELLFGQRIHPLHMTRLAVATFTAAFIIVLTTGFSIQTAIVFTVLMGAVNGVMTIARGVLPLALFGPVGYPRAAGVLAAANLGSQAIGPLAVAIIVERGSDNAALAIMAAFVTVSFVCFAAVRRQAAT